MNIHNACEGGNLLQFKKANLNEMPACASPDVKGWIPAFAGLDSSTQRTTKDKEKGFWIPVSTRNNIQAWRMDEFFLRFVKKFHGILSHTPYMHNLN